jgi:hypothetical protein
VLAYAFAASLAMIVPAAALAFATGRGAGFAAVVLLLLACAAAVIARTREARAAADQYARITAAFPVTQTSTDNLKATVVEFQRIAQRSSLPETALSHISGVLEKFPQFEIDRINWMSGDAARPAASGSEAAKPAAQGDALVRLEISGRVNATQRDDYRGITAQVQRFAGALAVSGYELARTQLPFDITSEGTLTGDIGGAGGEGDAPRFTVVLVRKLP